MAQVRYFVTDVAASVQFYVDALGFSVVQQFGPAMAIIQRDDLTLWLAGPGASASRPMPDGTVPEPGGWNRFVMSVDDIAATVDALRARGVGFRNEVVTGPGGQQILVEDPDGNVVEVFQPA
jgi:catechol 2,3-dioxygenase-like lactoylglutathione lyase family enzyme